MSLLNSRTVKRASTALRLPMAPNPFSDPSSSDGRECRPKPSLLRLSVGMDLQEAEGHLSAGSRTSLPSNWMPRSAVCWGLAMARRYAPLLECGCHEAYTDRRQ